MSVYADFGLFEGMSADDLDMVDRILVRRTVHDGHVFFRQGDQSSTTAALYLVLSGTVHVHAPGQKKGALGVDRRIGAGSLFGLLSLLDDAPRSATCTAVGPTEVAVLDRNAWRAIQSDGHRLGARFQLGVARQLASDLRSLSDRLTTAALGDEAPLLEGYVQA